MHRLALPPARRACAVTIHYAFRGYQCFTAIFAVRTKRPPYEFALLKRRHQVFRLPC